uniref:Uncharacterized protein n=1 Tax=Magallana gigas TaxID=29159 RepID=A0A8W8P0C7_MAGGI
MQFRNICDSPTQQNGSVLENVFYLENKGLIDVGKYNVLQKLFSEDNEALSEIEKVSKLIENTDPSTIRSTAGCHGQGESSRSQLYSFRAICYRTRSEFLKYSRHFTKSKDLEWGIFSVNGLLPELDYSVPFQSEKFCFIVLMLAEDMTFMEYQAYRAKKFSETHLL